ncbi:MAG: hypothetical protein HYV02_05015 [Deltaproteobacteria bacterium]|nr:hypothetical protein [Deltaproteobacteria bacterium]
MQIIRRHLRRNILVLSPEEMDHVDWSRVTKGCLYLDRHGKVTMELGHRGFTPWFHNTSWITLLVRQDRVYATLARRTLAAARSRPRGELIGARQFHYVRRARLLFLTSIAFLSWDEIVARGDPEVAPEVGEVRRNGYATLFALLDEIAARLGAAAAYTVTAVVAPEKLQRFGFFEVPPRRFVDRVLTWGLTFPLRQMRVFIKSYRRIPHQKIP